MKGFKDFTIIKKKQLHGDNFFNFSLTKIKLGYKRETISKSRHSKLAKRVKLWKNYAHTFHRHFWVNLWIVVFVRSLQEHHQIRNWLNVSHLSPDFVEVKELVFTQLFYLWLWKFWNLSLVNNRVGRYDGIGSNKLVNTIYICNHLSIISNWPKNHWRIISNLSCNV